MRIKKVSLRVKYQKFVKIPSYSICELIVLYFFPVVFMGSKKYPDENAFDAFIKKHGGSDNASTDCERVCCLYCYKHRVYTVYIYIYIL